MVSVQAPIGRREMEQAVQDSGTQRERVGIVEWWQDRHTQGEEFMDALGIKHEMRKCYRMFRGGTEAYIHKSRSASWRSGVVPPEAFRGIQQQVPRVVQGIAPHRQWFGVWTQNGNRRYEKIWNALLHENARRGKYLRDLIVGTQMCAVLGHAIGKVTYEVDIEDEIRDILQMDGSVGQSASPVVAFSGTKMQWISPFKVLQDPTGQGMWWIEKIPTTLEAMQEVNRRVGSTVYINLDALSVPSSRRDGPGGPQGLGSRHGVAASEGEDFTIEEVEGANAMHFRESGQHVQLWQCWGWVPPHIVNYGDGGQWRLIVIANGEHVVRDVPCPTHNRRPPYFNIPWIPLFGRLYGVSHLAYAGGLIDELTQLDRAKMDELLLSLHPQTILNADVQWDNKNWSRELGGIARVRGFGTDKPISNAIARFDTTPNLMNVWQERAAKRGQIDELMGAHPLFEGQAHSSRQTAEEIATLRTEGGMQFGMVAAWQNLTQKAEFLERTVGMLQRYMTDEQIVRVTGDQESVNVLVSNRDLQIPVEVVIDYGLFGPWGQLQAGVLGQMLPLLNSEPFAAWVKPREMFGDFLEHMGAPNADRYLFTTDEMEQRQRETFEQEMALLQQQGGAEGQPVAAGDAGGMGPGL